MDGIERARRSKVDGRQARAGDEIADYAVATQRDGLVDKVGAVAFDRISYLVLHNLTLVHMTGHFRAGGHSRFGPLLESSEAGECAAQPFTYARLRCGLTVEGCTSVLVYVSVQINRSDPLLVRAYRDDFGVVNAARSTSQEIACTRF